MAIRKQAPLVALFIVAAGVGGAGVDASAAPPSTAPTVLRRPTASPTATPSATPTATPTPTPTSTSSAPPPTGKPDLRCELVAWGAGSSPVTNGGSAKPIVESNGFHSAEYALKIKNDGGATGAPFVVRYDYLTTIGGQTFPSSKPNIPFPALAAGQEVMTPRLKVSGSSPFPNTHEITVTVDTANAVDESNETNNSCKFTVHVN